MKSTFNRNFVSVDPHSNTYLIALFGKNTAFCLFAFGLLWLACQSPTPAPQMGPEEVVQRWQYHIDQNEFDSARLYSTDATKAFVDFLESITHADSDTLIMSLTLLRELECKTSGDSAVCTFFIKDEIGRDISDTLLARRVKSRWLVDWRENPNDIPLDSLLEGHPEDFLFPGDSVDPQME